VACNDHISVDVPRPTRGEAIDNPSHFDLVRKFRQNSVEVGLNGVKIAVGLVRKFPEKRFRGLDGLGEVLSIELIDLYTHTHTRGTHVGLALQIQT